MKTALEILNQVEPNGELLDTDQALEAMELYAVEYAKSLKEDKSIISARQKESEVKSFMIPFEPLETNENGEIKCGDCNKFYRCVNCDEPCGSEGHWLTLARIGEISKITESFLKRRKSQKCSSCEIDEVITDGYCNCCGAKQLSYSPPKTEK
ncbi:MAG: hypothetical protein IPN99_13830 [Bacteroidetes bacterium]|jgi:hypothetical protein|nr:hypothetical protein [Bacteroidota bacterium]